MVPQPVPKSAQISPFRGAENHASRTVSVLKRCGEETNTETCGERGSQRGYVVAKGRPSFPNAAIFEDVFPPRASLHSRRTLPDRRKKGEAHRRFAFQLSDE